MRRSSAEILREYGPFPGIDHIHGVTYDGQQIWFAAGDRLNALDPVSGKTLWESPVLQGGGVATPVTYELDGKQYIAVMAGVAKGRIFTLALP